MPGNSFVIRGPDSFPRQRTPVISNEYHVTEYTHRR